MSAFQRLGLQPKSDTSPILSEQQQQTKSAFSHKWNKEDTYSSDTVEKTMKAWLQERYLDNGQIHLEDFLGDTPKIILDAGCGSGFSAMLLFGEFLNQHDYLGVDISDSVRVAEKRFAERNIKGEFLQCCIGDLPVPENSIDIIFSEGVLHHTDSTEESLAYLATRLKENGYFLFYVYAKKAVIREFTDDYIREQLRPLSDEEAWTELEALTDLGIQIGNINAEIEVKQDIPFLRIHKGTYSLQRFLYWNFCKMFYHPEMSFDEMNHTNFDWFRPLNCHRHTPEEVNAMCEQSGLKIIHRNIQPSGITVIAQKASTSSPDML